MVKASTLYIKYLEPTAEELDVIPLITYGEIYYQVSKKELMQYSKVDKIIEESIESQKIISENSKSPLIKNFVFVSIDLTHKINTSEIKVDSISKKLVRQIEKLPYDIVKKLDALTNKNIYRMQDGKTFYCISVQDWQCILDTLFSKFYTKSIKYVQESIKFNYYNSHKDFIKLICKYMLNFLSSYNIDAGSNIIIFNLYCDMILFREFSNEPIMHYLNIANHIDFYNEFYRRIFVVSEWNLYTVCVKVKTLDNILKFV